MRLARIAPLLAAASLTACAGGAGFGTYSLVQPGPRAVAAGRMTVTPPQAWNRVPRGTYDIREEENWTLNGPILDSVSFVAGLKDGKAIVRQRRRDDRQVPVFRANMTPPEIVAMIESFYRIRAGAAEFAVTGLKPATFVGRPGLQLDYDYLDGNEIKRRGRSYGAVVNGQLYLMLLDATRMHYFDAALPGFETMARGAALRG
ncbi:MAG TPA: hypothetical protein VEZ48_10365 [Sphingomonadaceae bacterium]|nr:hypothetical protein [Sphingomonadaceae bacterium]